MKEEIAEAYCNYLNKHSFGDIAVKCKIINSQEYTFIIKLNLAVTINGLNIFSGLRFIAFDPEKNGNLKLFIRGLDYGKNRSLNNPSVGFDYEDDVRRIRNEIDLFENPIFSVNNKGMVQTQKTVPCASSVSDNSVFVKLREMYCEARTELLLLYERTQRKLADHRAMIPPRDFDYRDEDLFKFSYDFVLFEETKRKTSQYAPSGNYFSRDGLYPYYSEQNPKILVLGRSSRRMGGLDYIETTLGKLQKDDKNDKTSRIVMRAIGCLLKSDTKTENMYQFFARPKKNGGFSYAFINVCPIDQEETHFEKKEDSIYWKAFSASKDILRQRIENLEPDCIIALSINGPKDQLHVVDTLFNNPPKLNIVHGYVDIFSITLSNGRVIPLLQTKNHPSERNGEWPHCQEELKTKFRRTLDPTNLWDNKDYQKILEVLAK